MVENSVKVLNEDDAKSINTLSNNIISVAKGVPNWIYFAEWLTQQGGLDALSDNFMTINGATGEIFLNGQNIISENLYQFISCMVDENRQEIQHIWEYDGNLAGFINYRNTKVTPSNDHDTDYMPHLKFLIARYNLENPNTSIFLGIRKLLILRKALEQLLKCIQIPLLQKCLIFIIQEIKKIL